MQIQQALIPNYIQLSLQIFLPTRVNLILNNTMCNVCVQSEEIRTVFHWIFHTWYNSYRFGKVSSRRVVSYAKARVQILRVFVFM